LELGKIKSCGAIGSQHLRQLRGKASRTEQDRASVCPSAMKQLLNEEQRGSGVRSDEQCTKVGRNGLWTAMIPGARLLSSRTCV